MLFMLDLDRSSNCPGGGLAHIISLAHFYLPLLIQ